LVRLELGGTPSGGEKQKAESEPKEPASKDQSTSSDPEALKKEEMKSKDESTTSPPPPEKKPEPKESPPPKQSEPQRTGSKSTSSAPTFGSREERRVSCKVKFMFGLLTVCLGQDEPHAPTNCREIKAIAKYSCLPYNVQ
jgi:hypothetical protein